MKKRIFPIILILATVCVLLLPALASGVALANAAGSLMSAGSSLTDFVSYSQNMLSYTDELMNAVTLQDFYSIAANPSFQQDTTNLINSYYTLLSKSRLLSNLAAAQSTSLSDDFGKDAWNLLYYANTLLNADTAQEYSDIIANADFVQGIDDFIASYNKVISELNSYAYPGSYSKYYPVYTLRPGIPASLTTKMATRLGPGTKYSEELGTFAQSTAITVIEQVMVNDVAWALVDFTTGNDRYRAYTGMKRINADQAVPWGNTEPISGATLQQTEAYYGPGYNYARHPDNVPANTQLYVYGVENGFLICDFQRGDEWIRAYIPWDARIS